MFITAFRAQFSCVHTGGGQKKVAICQTNDMIIFIFNFVILQE